LIREEESQTGEKSKRAYDATAAQAATDPEVHKTQSASKFKTIFLFLVMEKLKEMTDQFLTAIIGSMKKMPFGVRYIGQQLKEIMRTKFPGNDAEVDKMVGNLIYYRYINPAIM
jgi:hypothetical protein